MRVLLIQSSLDGAEPPVYPIGLASIAANLTGHDVKIFDPNISAKPYDELRGVLRGFSPDVAAISLRNIDSTNKRVVVFYYEYMKRLVDVVKEASGARVIVGGAGFSMYAAEIMEDEPRIDYGVYLEGELTLGKLLDNLDSPGLVPSVYYRKNGGAVFSGYGSRPDVNQIAPPRIESAPVGPYLPYRDSIGVETKRGCALSCVYCIYGFLNGKTYRLKDPVRIVDEIESLAKNHGVTRFTFVDSVFNIPRDHAEAILREIVKRGVKVKWSAWFNEKGFTEEFALLAVEAGCVNFILSPDGFSDGTLKELGKNISRDDILRVFAILEKIGGVEVSYNFFKNPPGQTLGNFISLALFCLRAKRSMKRRVHFEFNSIRVEPHTRLYEIALREKLVSNSESLLKPLYYTNRKTWHIEALFNAILRLKGK